MNDVLEVEAVTKRFGKIVANAEVSLRVRPGEVLGLLGHNGAGKTTLVSQIVGLLRPDAGSIRVAGIDAVAHPATARRHVALQAQGQAPLDGLTPRMAIELAGRVRGLSPRAARDAAADVAEQLEIAGWLDRRALPDGRGLSGGVRRLTSFAMTVVAPTPLVVLDEPTNDIDAMRRRKLWDAVRGLGDRGSGVLLVTHNVAEAERVVDDLVILDHGAVVATGSPSSLRGSNTHLRLELQLHPDGDPGDSLDRIPFPTIRTVRAGRRVLVTLPETEAAAAVGWATALRNSRHLDGYALTPATLEDAYIAVTASPEAVPEELIHV